jgi:hypothetical protein
MSSYRSVQNDIDMITISMERDLYDVIYHANVPEPIEKMMKSYTEIIGSAIRCIGETVSKLENNR